MEVAEVGLIHDVGLSAGLAGGLGEVAGDGEVGQGDEDQPGAAQVRSIRNAGDRRWGVLRCFQRGGRAVRREPGQFGRAVQEQAELRQGWFTSADDDDFRPFERDGCQKDAHRTIP
ncbi:hypothetical protein D3C80_1390740 [compost metagenome]